MAAVSPLLPSCNAGEFTPRLAARTDFNKYPAGREVLENLIALSEGGAMRRAGTRFVGEVKDSTKETRLKSFEFSTVQAYALQFGAGFVRIARHQGQISVAETDALVSNGGFETTIAGWTDESTGSGAVAWSAGRLGLTPGGATSSDIAWAEQEVTVGASFTAVEHVLKFRVIGAAGDKVQLRIGTTTTGAEVVTDTEFGVGYHCHAFTPGATTIYVQFRNRGEVRNKALYIDDVDFISDAPVEIGSPYAEADLFRIEGPQSTDALFLFHNGYHPYVLTRSGNASWSLTLLDFQDGPWDAQNSTATTLDVSAVTGAGITVTASAIAGINGGRGFLATDVGRLIRIDNIASGTNWGWGRIVGWTSSTVVTLDVRRDFSTTDAIARWRLGSWSDTTGWPGNGTFVEQRLGACRTLDRPQTFWLSETNGFSASHVSMSPDSPDETSGNWDGGVQDDDAIDWTISSDQVESIQWMSAGQSLVLGTSGAEWVATSSGSVLTPTDVEVTRHTKHGSARVQPARVDHVVLFLQRAGRKLRELAFSFEVDGFRAPDMTRLAQHIAFGGIREMAFQQEPDNLIWAVRGDGQLLCMTYRRDEDVVGWSRHVLGGAFASGDAVVESVAVIPGADGAGQVQSSEDRDEVWLIVKRTINGQTRRYLEVLERDFEDGHDQEDAYYLDSIITYNGAATRTITGLGHLEGQTVGIWGDGAIRPDKVVTAGAITLDDDVSVAQIGLRYRHRMKTLKLDAGAVTGTAVGKKKRITGVTLVVHNSHTVGYGRSFDALEMIDFREVGDAVVVPLFTGERFKEFPGDWGSDERICLESDDPAPFMLLALAPNLTTNELR